MRGPAHNKLALSGALALSLLLSGPTAYAAGASSADLQRQASEMAGKVQEATHAHQEALAEVESLNEQIEEGEAHLADIQAQLPAQRERTAASIKSLYMLQQSSADLLDIVLSSEDLNSFVSAVHYIDTLQERNTNEIHALTTMADDAAQTQAALQMERETAAQREEDARVAMEEAQALRVELQAQADAAARAEQAAREQAIAAARQKASGSGAAATVSPGGMVVQDTTAAQAPSPQAAQQGEAATPSTTSASPAAQPVVPTTTTPSPAPAQTNPPAVSDEAPAPAAPVITNVEPVEEEEPPATFTTSSGATAAIEVAPEPSASTEPIVTNATSDEVSSWAARIDAYLAGSPLEGYGIDFAQAASDFGVDPRVSPAIACVESGKGAICFLPHNAWGWGSSSWPDWPSAIRDHVAGFASGYGSTVTLEGAERYCPPTYQEWYSTVLSEMSMI